VPHSNGMRSKAPVEGESRTDGDGSRGPGIEHHQGGFLVDNVVRETAMTGNPYNVTLDTHAVEQRSAHAGGEGDGFRFRWKHGTITAGEYHGKQRGRAARNASADSVHTGLGNATIASSRWGRPRCR
jgi:hypothetical protein